ncbi:MAG TPA: cysteine-rich CWC family protein [Burkholderiales bacterium]|nr:cysteine-rich CWC family protein [Burkholderiales bacterium]
MDSQTRVTQTVGEPNRRCPRCGAAFACDHQAGRDPCWCSRDFPRRLPLPGSRGGCLCPSCLAAALKPSAPPNP